MTTEGNEQERDTSQPEHEGTIPMGDQGPSYSSSYNESTPGEIIANRRKSLREEGDGDEPRVEGEEHSAPQRPSGEKRG